MYCGGRDHHRYVPVEEGTEAETTTTSTAGFKWVGFAAVLLLSAALVGSSRNSAVSSSENQRLREGTSAVNMHSNVVNLVS